METQDGDGVGEREADEMALRNTSATSVLPVPETPEDVAVLYSWANLQGAKYRDFSASRREYRAQMRHRAAELLHEQELQAAATAEAAAAAAEAEAAAAAQAAAEARHDDPHEAEYSRQLALYEAEQAARKAAAERLEAARRADAAAYAESVARHEAREIAEAQASSIRQAAQYAESEVRVRQSGMTRHSLLPGRISDPYAPAELAESFYYNERPGTPIADLEATRFRKQREYLDEVTGSGNSASRGVAQEESHERNHGLRQSEPSGFRRAVRASQAIPDVAEPIQRGYYATHEQDEAPKLSAHSTGSHTLPSTPYREYKQAMSRGASTEEQPSVPFRMEPIAPLRAKGNSPGRVGLTTSSSAPNEGLHKAVWPEQYAAERSNATIQSARPAPDPVRFAEVGLRSQAPSSASVSSYREPVRTATLGPQPVAGRATADANSWREHQAETSRVRNPDVPIQRHETAGPAWLTPTPLDGRLQRASAVAYQPVYQPVTQPTPRPMTQRPEGGDPARSTGSGQLHPQMMDTLQHSRERVASRWYALKGIFEQPRTIEEPSPQTNIVGELPVPMLAVFSLAGGVGKTSLVATLGRTLSSMGEKVLLTDTTTHGLLPYYFGASEMLPGVVRTFSPPADRADAPISLVSYDVDPYTDDVNQQEEFVHQLARSSRGVHRVLLDLTNSSTWMARRLGRLRPTVIVPLSPDMNSVISLHAVRRFFQTLRDSEGRPIDPFFVLNQFDAGLPLHLDVREVLGQQLGQHLLPFVIRRSPAVSEALAEGMTVFDYATESPVAQDYRNIATWLRGIATAPASAGRSARWSER